MPKAIWNDVVIAESDHYEEVEGNVYFPPESIRREFFSESSTKSVCPWKGTARYFTLTVNGQQNKDAAWYYADPSGLAQSIKGRIAFWKGVQVID